MRCFFFKFIFFLSITWDTQAHQFIWINLYRMPVITYAFNWYDCEWIQFQKMILLKLINFYQSWASKWCIWTSIYLLLKFAINWNGNRLFDELKSAHASSSVQCENAIQWLNIESVLYANTLAMHITWYLVCFIQHWWRKGRAERLVCWAMKRWRSYVHANNNKYLYIYVMVSHTRTSFRFRVFLLLLLLLYFHWLNIFNKWTKNKNGSERWCWCCCCWWWFFTHLYNLIRVKFHVAIYHC